MKKEIAQLDLLHVLNDGLKAGLILLLPFIAKEFAIDLTRVGILGSAVNSLDIIMALPAGYLATKFGGKRIIVWAVFFWLFGYLITGVAPVYFLVIIAFLIAGIGFGVFHPIAYALVSKMFEKGERGKQLGNFTALGELGRVGISSLITIVIVSVGWRNVALSIALILLFIGFFLFRIIKNKADIDEPFFHTSYRALFQNKKFILSTISYCLDTLASGSLYIFIPFLLLQRHVPYIFLGVFTSTFFIGNMFGKIVLGRLVDKFGNTKMFVISEVLMALFIVILSNSVSLVLIIISSVILGVFTKGTSPILTTMISESVDHHGKIDKAFGLNAVFVGVASTSAPFALILPTIVLTIRTTIASPTCSTIIGIGFIFFCLAMM